jgi:hypothetical protein
VTGASPEREYSRSTQFSLSKSFLMLEALWLVGTDVRPSSTSGIASLRSGDESNCLESQAVASAFSCHVVLVRIMALRIGLDEAAVTRASEYVP